MAVLNIAHRGFSGEYPENTMLAFRKALEAGSDGIELDVHLTRDGQVVIIHDEALVRTTGEKGCVHDYPLEELRRFDASKIKPGKFDFEPIPTLEEYFDWVMTTDLITNIELKNGIVWYEGMEQKVIDMIRARHLEKKIIFSSFNHESIRLCEKLAPDIERGFLYGDWLLDGGKYAKAHGVQYMHPNYITLTKESVDEIYGEGIRINTWTVNEEADMHRMLDFGVNAIITNFPDRLASILRG